MTIQRGIADADILLQLVSILESRFRHSLRRIDFRIDSSDLSTSHLPLIPLASLDMDAIYLPDGGDFSLAHRPWLETVSTLTLDLPMVLQHDPEYLYFPNLRHLGLINIRDVDCPAINHLIARHSASIVSLYFQTASCDELPLLISLATNLRSLVFDDADFA